MNVMSKINDIREGWRHPNLKISDLLVTKMGLSRAISIGRRLNSI
jgi:hypothetical protein